MCDVTRRGFLGTAAAFLSSAAEAELMEGAAPSKPDAYRVEEVVPGVHFAKGDTEGRGFCNSGFVVFEDYVLAIDATYPAGARDLVRGIRAVTPKPIRFAFDTHHHGDHSYGNQVLVESGATPVAHVGVVDEMHRYETGYYADKPGRWEGSTSTTAKGGSSSFTWASATPTVTRSRGCPGKASSSAATRA